MSITEKRLIDIRAQVIGPAHPDDPALGGGDDA